MSIVRYGVFPDAQRWKLIRDGQALGSYDTQPLAIEAGRMAARAEPPGVRVQLDVLDYYGELHRADMNLTGPATGRATVRPG